MLDFIVVIGDLNDAPDGAPFRALLGSNSNLLDIMKHEKFVGDSRPIPMVMEQNQES
jgi:hypothetical protein